MSRSFLFPVKFRRFIHCDGSPVRGFTAVEIVGVEKRVEEISRISKVCAKTKILIVQGSVRRSRKSLLQNAKPLATPSHFDVSISTTTTRTTKSF